MGRRRSIETGARRGTRASSLSLHAVSVAALGLALAACQDAAPTAPALGTSRAPSLATAPNAASDVIPDQYIVTFADSVKDAPGLAKQLAAQHGASVRFTYASALKGFAAHMSAQAAAALQKNPKVTRVEQDAIAAETDVQSAPPAWGLDRVDQRALPLDKMYASSANGAGVTVYIVDSGIRTTHRDFGGRATGGFTSVSDGYGAGDCSGHGTHVAGIVGGATFGVAKGVRLVSVRVLGCDGTGTISGIISGVDWVTGNRVLPAVANMSLGASVSSTLDQAVQSSIASGVVYATSAGNGATDACTQSPARVAAALTVGSSQSNDAQAPSSNYGTCVDVYAPGNAILSLGTASDTATAYKSGTSMASPHVAGAAALYLAANPGATPAQVSQALVANATAGLLTALGANSPNRLLYTGFIAGSPAPTTPVDSAPVATPPTMPPTLPSLPKASFLASCTKALCSFDASGSTGGAAPFQYAWSFGDASATASGGGARATHQYLAKGTFTVTLTVTDATGLTASASTSVGIKKL